MIDNWDWPEDERERRRILYAMYLYIFFNTDVDFSRIEPDPISILIRSVPDGTSKRAENEKFRLKRESTVGYDTSDPLKINIANMVTHPKANELIDDPSSTDSIKQMFNLLSISEKKGAELVDEFLRPILGEPLW